MGTNTKEWIQYGSAMFMVGTGALLAFVSFLTVGTVVGGVLLYISEALIFAGGIYGVNIYYRTKFGEFKSTAMDTLKENTNTLKDDVNTLKDNVYKKLDLIDTKIKEYFENKK